MISKKLDDLLTTKKKEGCLILNQNLPKYLAVSEWMKQQIYHHRFKSGEKLISENHYVKNSPSVDKRLVKRLLF